MAPTFLSLSSRLINDGAHMNRPESLAFLTFHIVGGAGNLAMLLTAIFSKRVKRHSTWLNFCVTWIIFSLSYTLLLFAGRQFSEAPPSYPLCLTQASLIYAAPVIGASSTLALITQIWLSLRRIITSNKLSPRPRDSHAWDIILVIIPYITWLGVVLGVLILGLRSPQDVSRTDTSVYCFIKTGVPGHISAAFVAVLLVIAIILEILIGTFLYKYWNAYSKLRTLSSISLSLVLRTGLFVVLNIVAISQIAIFFARQFVIVNVWISLTPLAAVAVFATQRDMLRVWTLQSASREGERQA